MASVLHHAPFTTCSAHAPSASRAIVTRRRKRRCRARCTGPASRRGGCANCCPCCSSTTMTARKLGRRLRKVTRRLGAVRELDVLLLLIDELHGPPRPQRRARARRRRRREATATSARKRLRDAAADRRAAPARREARTRGRASCERCRGDAGARRRAQLALGARRARRRARRALRAAIDDAGAVYLPERLHAVRIALKKLRYALELVDRAAGRARARRAAALKRGQELLGRLHDLQVLIDRVRQVQASLTPPNVDRLARARRARRCRSRTTAGGCTPATSAARAR